VSPAFSVLNVGFSAVLSFNVTVGTDVWVHESKDASVYGFTGRITTPDDTYKIIYTAKLSTFSKINAVSTEFEKSDNLSISILMGSSSQGVSSSYGGTTYSDQLRYLSQDIISVKSGTTITIVNNDKVSHNIISGTEASNDRNVPFTPDGRISTGEITPGESVNITFDDLGIYRLYDPDYTWIRLLVLPLT